MPGSQPGTAQAEATPDGGVRFIDPAADVGEYTLPPGSPGALMLQGPREALLNPRPTIAGRRVIPLPVRPGTTGRLVRNQDGTLAVTPWSLPRVAVAPVSPAASLNVDPPLGANAAIQGLPDGSVVVLPLSQFGYPGSDDAGPINEALQRLPTWTDPDTGLVYQRGTVRLAAANYNILSQITVPPQANLIGSGPGTVLNVSGNIIGIYKHHPVTPNNNNLTKSGVIADLHLDGLNSTAGAIGIDVGDGWGHTLRDIYIANFMQAGSIGLSVANRNFWTEKASFKHIQIVNCATCAQFWAAAGGAQSHEYNDVELYIRIFAAGKGSNTTTTDQRGVVWIGVNWNGSMKVRGNAINGFTLASVPAPAFLSAYTDSVNLTNTLLRGFLDFQTESSGTGQTPYKIFFGDTAQVFGPQLGGILKFAGGTDPAAPAIGQFMFKGVVDDVASLRQPQNPPFPLTGVGYTNVQCDSIVWISGGAVTQVKTDGVVQGNVTGPFFVPMNRVINVTYTGSPSWTWTAAL